LGCIKEGRKEGRKKKTRDMLFLNGSKNKKKQKTKQKKTKNKTKKSKNKTNNVREGEGGERKFIAKQNKCIPVVIVIVIVNCRI
jgi:type IV secretory pathway VirB10-like protein